jgi:hypothetical protein
MIMPRIPAAATVAAWNAADIGEKIACVAPPAVITNGARIGKNSRDASRNCPGYGMSNEVKCDAASARAWTNLTPMSPE